MFTHVFTHVIDQYNLLNGRRANFGAEAKRTTGKTCVCADALFGPQILSFSSSPLPVPHTTQLGLFVHASWHRFVASTISFAQCRSSQVTPGLRGTTTPVVMLLNVFCHVIVVSPTGILKSRLSYAMATNPVFPRLVK